MFTRKVKNERPFITLIIRHGQIVYKTFRCQWLTRLNIMHTFFLHAIIIISDLLGMTDLSKKSLLRFINYSISNVFSKCSMSSNWQWINIKLKLKFLQKSMQIIIELISVTAIALHTGHYIFERELLIIVKLLKCVIRLILFI